MEILKTTFEYILFESTLMANKINSMRTDKCMEMFILSNSSLSKQWEHSYVEILAGFKF